MPTRDWSRNGIHAAEKRVVFENCGIRTVSQHQARPEGRGFPARLVVFFVQPLHRLRQTAHERQGALRSKGSAKLRAAASSRASASSGGIWRSSASSSTARFSPRSVRPRRYTFCGLPRRPNPRRLTALHQPIRLQLGQVMAHVGRRHPQRGSDFGSGGAVLLLQKGQNLPSGEHDICHLIITFDFLQKYTCIIELTRLPRLAIMPA